MTRERLFAIANEYGLRCDVERVTAGPADGNAFREFEFVPMDQHGYPINACTNAAKDIRQEWGVNPAFTYSRQSDIDGGRYVCVTSFWCEPATVTV